MTKEEYILLYEKCASGNGSDQEKTLLEEYKDAFSLEDTTWNEELLGNRQEVTAEIYKTLSENLFTKNKVRTFSFYRFAAAAAIVFGVLFSGLYYFYFRNPESGILTAKEKHSRKNILPGKNAAILTLADGSVIALSDTVNGVISRQGSAMITKTRDGKLIYDLSGASSRSFSGTAIPYNTLSTPRGSEYQLVLPDGTKVWLNAQTSLKFPAVFAAKERRVELSGEAYFEVAKKANRPFKVLAGGTEVEVLGTHFNVNAYSNHTEVSTTLLEGSVRLSKNGHQALLKAGQEGISTSGSFRVQKADTENAVAWKNGYLMFQDENIRTIMEKASRWYDIEVEYRGNLEDKEFWGKVPRYQNISELLKNMELTGTVHFKTEGRRIIVMP